jgi:mono/diheme cytochrome c family protein
MPSYADVLDEEQRWYIVSYTLRLMGRTDLVALKEK